MRSRKLEPCKHPEGLRAVPVGTAAVLRHPEGLRAVPVGMAAVWRSRVVNPAMISSKDCAGRIAAERVKTSEAITFMGVSPEAQVALGGSVSPVKSRRKADLMVTTDY